MYTDLKYVKTETMPNVFEMNICGKKMGMILLVP